MSMTRQSRIEWRRQRFLQLLRETVPDESERNSLLNAHARIERLHTQAVEESLRIYKGGG